MAPFFQIITAAALAAISFAASYGYVEEVKCTLAGSKCAGAPGKPKVPYAPCCDESKVCMPEEKLGWGNFCVDAKEGYEKCYANGERAVGEEGYDYVPYFACCAGYPVEDKKRGYGQFCYTPKEYVQKYYVTYPDPIVQKKPKYGYKYTGSYESKYAPKPSMPGYKEEYKTHSTTSSKTPKYTAPKYDDKYADTTPEPTTVEYY